MVNPSVAYFFKRFYRNIIKWWYVIYNPSGRIVSFSKEDEEYTKQLKEEKEKKQKERERKIALAYGLPDPEENIEKAPITDDNYNKTTGAFSGLYGQKPVDESTKSALDEIMTKSKHEVDIASLLQQQEGESGHQATDKPGQTQVSDEVILPPEQDEIVQEANEIYERLLKEAAEDEAKKQAEIEAAKAERETLEATQE